MNILKELKLSRKENKQLKKLLANYGIVSTCENCEEFGICPHSYREYDYKCELDKVTIQQKEFIEWLENEIDICDGFLDTVKSDLQEIHYEVISANKTYITTRIKENEIAHKLYKEILQKYKEIIGGDK